MTPGSRSDPSSGARLNSLCRTAIPSCSGPASERRPPPPNRSRSSARPVEPSGRLRKVPPFGLRCVRCQSRARDIERRQVYGLPREPPRGESQVERGNLGATRVDLQPEEGCPAAPSGWPSSTETRSSAIRSRTRSSNASTRKWPLPQHGSRTRRAAASRGPFGK